ncbi:MAG: c-type cytochrome [Thermodesulfobacteriota bacterium]
MTKSFSGILIFTVAIILVFVYIGEVLTKISGQRAGPADVITGVSPEAGETVFWGRGKCHTCHSIGNRGSAIRAPNLGGTGPLNLPIGARAERRAKERQEQGESGMSATDYLVESIADPSAYVVEGFKNEMPLPHRPPINLKAEEIRAVITYLQSLGGEVDAAAIKLPPAITAARATVVEEWKPLVPVDVEVGKEIFFDPESNAACAKCHKVGEKGGEVGPELTALAGTRTFDFIIKSILDPNAEIASGFEATLIVTKDGRYLTGIVKKEDASTVYLADKEGTIEKVPKTEIEEIAPQETSMMPGNFKEILTIDEFYNLMAFLLTLK